VSTEGPKGETRVIQPTPAERTVARRAAESRATVPHLELSVSLSSPAAFDTARVIRACALSLVEHPRANAAYRDGHFELYARINIGLVVAAEDTYLIPTVFDADRKAPDELHREVQELRSGALGGRLGPPDFSGATFTVWNAGELGIAQAALPVVPPQAAVLTAGTASLTLTCDHRILYGAGAAGFLASVSRRLEAGAD
jgi:pyruvate dehydrogenase E2 component (dihydrolipoyllysine-residue acetyltransferase)